jgi:TonB family protein
MKKLSLIICAVLIGAGTFAQTEKKYPKVDTEAEYTGGPEAMFKYISENVQYPAKAIETNVQGKVYVAFMISKTGEIQNAKVLRAVSPELDAEALRIVNGMTKWTPAQLNGENVPFEATLPINFSLD